MRNLFFLLLCLFIIGCQVSRNLEFVVVNTDVTYLDSLDKNVRIVKVPYPADAMNIARPFFLQRNGAKWFRKCIPFRICLFNDSTWMIWEDGSLYYDLKNKHPMRVGWVGVCINIYNGEIVKTIVNR